MASYKFFSVGKANAEIERLEVELAKSQSEAKEASDNASEVVTAAEASQATWKQASADLETSKTSISSLTARAEKAEAALKVATEQLASPPAQIQTAAALKAAEITSAQGQPPIKVTTPENLTGENKATSGLKGLAAVQAHIKAELAAAN